VAQRGGAHGEATVLGWLREDEGCHPLGGPVGLHGPCRLTGWLRRLGQKPGKNSFKFK
jgi:hypothetical protein